MIKGKLRPIRDDVLVSHMYFGETKTKGGIIIGDDNAKAHGVKPPSSTQQRLQLTPKRLHRLRALLSVLAERTHTQRA